MDFSIDMMSLGDADAIIFWIKEKDLDFIIFLDGGNPGDGKKVVKHYQDYIEPYTKSSAKIILINSHPHRDHIGGSSEIISYFGSKIWKVYFNDPLKYINSIQRNLINEYYQKKFKLEPLPIFSGFNLLIVD